MVDHEAAVRWHQGVIVGRLETLDFLWWERFGVSGVECLFGIEAQLPRTGRKCGC